jgi:hypothetical protein
MHILTDLVLLMDDARTDPICLAPHSPILPRKLGDVAWKMRMLTMFMTNVGTLTLDE